MVFNLCVLLLLMNSGEVMRMFVLGVVILIWCLKEEKFVLVLLIVRVVEGIIFVKSVGC